MARHIRNSLYSQTVEGPLALGSSSFHEEESGLLRSAANDEIPFIHAASGEAAPQGRSRGATTIIYLVGLSEGLTHLAALAIYYLLKDDLGFSPAATSAILILPALPWFLKPVLAFVSDTQPILGLRRKPYLIVFSILETVGYVLLAMKSDSIIAVAAALAIVSLGAAFCSAVTEALVVQSTHAATGLQSPEDEEASAQAAANRSVTELLGAKAIGSLVVAYLSGALLEVYTKRQVFLATATFPLLITVSAACYSETGEEQLISPRLQLRVLLEFLKQPIVWGPAAFIVMFMMGPDYDDALFYFFTSKLGFSPTFMGSLRFTYGLAALIGLVAYNSWLRNSSYRSIMVWTILVNFPIYISPLLLVSGVNKRMGISNEVFVLSGGFLVEAVAELQLLPLLVFTALICPPGLEGSVYSVMMSVRNLGAALGKLSSSIAAYLFGITATNFSKLVPFILICGIFTLTPLFFIKLIPTPVEMEDVRKANVRAKLDKDHRPPLIESQEVWTDVQRSLSSAAAPNPFEEPSEPSSHTTNP